MTKDTSTEEKILEAATKIFQEKGYAGARMDDIAQEAGINRALLHYYFRSKDKMFQQVFRKTLSGFINQMIGIIGGDLPLDERVQKVVDGYSDTFLKYRNIPLFVLGELRQNPERLTDFIVDEKELSPFGFISQIQELVKAGKIRPVDPRQFLVNLMSLTVFPFIMEPLLKKLFGMDEAGFVAFIEERRKEIPKFLFSSLKP